MERKKIKNKGNSRSRTSFNNLKICLWCWRYSIYLKTQEIFNELEDERREKITDLDKKVNSDDLIYRYIGNTADVKFDKFDNALNIINKIQNGEINLADVKNNQEKFKSYIGEIKAGNKKHRSKEQKKKHFVQYWNALQSKKWSCYILWWLFFNDVWSKN